MVALQKPFVVAPFITKMKDNHLFAKGWESLCFIKPVRAEHIYPEPRKGTVLGLLTFPEPL